MIVEQVTRTRMLGGPINFDWSRARRYAREVVSHSVTYSADNISAQLHRTMKRSKPFATEALAFCLEG